VIGQIDRRRLVRPMVAVGHVRTRVRTSAIRYVSVESRLVVVLVVGAVPVFLGWMDMNQRGSEHSNQERCTEYCHASLSHKTGMLYSPNPGVKKQKAVEAAGCPSILGHSARAVVTRMA